MCVYKYSHHYFTWSLGGSHEVDCPGEGDSGDHDFLWRRYPRNVLPGAGVHSCSMPALVVAVDRQGQRPWLWN